MVAAVVPWVVWIPVVLVVGVPMVATVVSRVVGIPLVVEAGFLMAAVVVRIAEEALVGEIPVVGEDEEGKYLIFRLSNKATT